MTQKEFTERTGFKPTAACYHELVEPEYVNSDLDKDEWCKQWKKNGGIQKAYDWQCKVGADDAAKAANLEHDLNEANDIKNQRYKELSKCLNENNDLHKQNEDLTNDKMNLVLFLIEQAEKWSATDLREKAIELIGAKAYLSYKIKHEMNLWQLDKELLIENLK